MQIFAYFAKWFETNCFKDIKHTILIQNIINFLLNDMARKHIITGVAIKLKRASSGSQLLSVPIFVTIYNGQLPQL